LGAVRMVLATTVTDDLGAVVDELSTFADRFGVGSRSGAAGAGAGA
jgi:hypothetical protein